MARALFRKNFRASLNHFPPFNSGDLDMNFKNISWCGADVVFVTAIVCVTHCADHGDDAASTGNFMEYCAPDSSNSGYDLAFQYDECVGKFAQSTTARIESDAIDVRVDYLPPIGFYSARARLSKDEKWVHAYYTFLPEDTSGYDDEPAEMNGALLLKMRTKESIDKAFGFDQKKSHGICRDVQQVIYNNVLNSMLTEEEQSRYKAEGRKITFVPDDDLPPLDATTNPVGSGGEWLARDPASAVEDRGDSLAFGPPALYIESDDPTLPANMDEGLKGVMYCKLFSHQLILHWMRVKSFEDNPSPIAPTAGDACAAPLDFEAPSGSCVFYFAPADSYYCSDYTGYGFDRESAMEKCDSRLNTETLETEYSEKPCDQRLDEIESKIPDYAGFLGACIVHCHEAGEFLWNVYQEDLEPRCSGYPFITAEEKQAVLEGSD